MGIIDDSGSTSQDIELKTYDDHLLDELEQRIKAERARRHEERQVTFPLEWEGFRLGTSKSDNDHEAIELNLPEKCANYFRYAGLEVFFRVIISEDGTVMASHINEPHTGNWIALERPIRMNCA